MSYVPIDRYLDFWTIPHVFVITYKGVQLFFDGGFDYELEDHPADFGVFVLPNVDIEKLKNFEGLRKMATRSLGKIPVARVPFAPERHKKAIDAAFLEELGREHGLW